MALTCPRCGTDVPSEVLYCPYCSLPKPKRGFTAPEVKPQEPAPIERPRAAVAVRRATDAGNKRAINTSNKRTATAANRSARRSTARPGKQPRKLRVSVLSVAALVVLFSVGAYIFVVPMVYSEQAEPKTVLTALDKLRKTPSSEAGLTIDARLSRELETARRVGNLVSYQGWNVRPIKGTKAKVVLAFSYVEAGDVHQNAEWIADLTGGTFTPQTELATAVSSR